MDSRAWIGLLFLAGCAGTRSAAPRPPPPATSNADGIPQASASMAVEPPAEPTSAPVGAAAAQEPSFDFRAARDLLEEAKAAQQEKDLTLAAAIAGDAIEELLARPDSERNAEWLGLLDESGGVAFKSRDVLTANRAFAKVHEVRARSLPIDHPGLQRARSRLAATFAALDDHASLHELEAQILATCERILPAEHQDLQQARMNLAGTSYRLDDFERARVLYEAVLAVRLQTLSEDDPEVQVVRGALASALHALGDMQAARTLQEQTIESLSRTLPEEHSKLQSARIGLASTLKALGELDLAREIQTKALEIGSRTLSEDHLDLLAIRGNLALTLKAQGDLEGARTLEEQNLAAFTRKVPDEDPDLQRARVNLAVTLDTLGELAAARALEEKVLGIFIRSLPDGNRELQTVRLNLARTILKLGDIAGARELLEQALAIGSRTMRDEHPDLANARQNLAAILYMSGDYAGALFLFEKVLAIHEARLPEHDPDLQTARANVALTLSKLGELERARALQEQVLAAYSSTLSEQALELQQIRHELSVTLYLSGDLAAARRLQEQVCEALSKAASDGDSALQAARHGLAMTLLSEAAQSTSEAERRKVRERVFELLGAVARSHTHQARELTLSAPAREAEERCASLASRLDVVISAAMGYGVFDGLGALEAEALAYDDATRAGGLVANALIRKLRDSPRSMQLREQWSAANAKLVQLARQGMNSEQFQAARGERESLERELLQLARSTGAGDASKELLDPDRIREALDPRQAAVVYRRYRRWSISLPSVPPGTDRRTPGESFVESVCAFVVRGADTGEQRAGTSPLALVDLGSFARIEAAVRSWREGLGAAGGRGVSGILNAADESANARGAALRRLVLDPLSAALGDASHLIVVLDDALHLVPLDALPLDDASAGSVGDLMRIETRATLGEAFDARLPLPGSGELVGLGGAAFDAADQASNARAGILRGSAWASGFTALPASLEEVEGVQALFASAAGADAARTVLCKAEATKKALAEHAPRARWLHLATHGWYASESIPSWNDPEPLDNHTGLGLRMSGQQQIRGMSPLLLCGLALAGANSPDDTVGQTSGLLTADEISSWDLSNCELAVLSACDTARGEIRRAGQGVASLQKALQMAGARSVITSLWKVPDEATKDLMLDFYRRLWVEKKPKWQALWEAKQKMREAKDASGNPRYTTRDWAAWVLTGEPD